MTARRHSYTRLTATRRDAFLAHLAACGNVTAAAYAIGVTRIALYKLKDRDTAFEEAWTLALDRYAASLEAELHWRECLAAHDGYDPTKAAASISR